MSRQLLRVRRPSFSFTTQPLALQTPRFARILVPFPFDHGFLLGTRMLLLQQGHEPPPTLLHPAVNEHDFLILRQDVKLNLKMDFNVSPNDVDAALIFREQHK